ncbi:hypothetical protein I546_3996 [Mycobacterium kansasii 732]|nr:hypothetical protein I546_3996 [Mycobacterium kansasii 732]
MPMTVNFPANEAHHVDAARCLAALRSRGARDGASAMVIGR